MFAMTILLVLVAWGFVGFFAFSKLTKHTGSSYQRKLFLLLFAAAWLLAPFADEIIGKERFDRHCEQLPLMTILNKIELGPGLLFDERGQPRWQRREDLMDWNAPYARVIDSLVKARSESTAIAGLPFPIEKRVSVFYDARTGVKLYEKVNLHSYGGTVKRMTGLGYMMQYNCTSPGTQAQLADLVTYKPGAQDEQLTEPKK